MPTPEGINLVPLHGLYVEPDEDGTPLQGTVSFTPNPTLITFPNENTMMAGTETVTLDANGEFNINLPCTDTPDQVPDGWTYSVQEKLIGIRPRAYQILLPYNGGAAVELADITPTEAAPNYIPVTGPQGAPGLVQSVNGISMADVVLTAEDVEAVPEADVDQPGGVLGIHANGRVGIGNGAPWAKFVVQDDAEDVILAAFVQTTVGATQPGFLVQGPDAAWTAFGASVGGDTNNRFNFTAGGSLTWGDGTDPTDTELGRSAAGELTTDLLVVATPTASGHATTKDYVDTLDGANVKVTGTQSVAGVKTFSSSVYVTGAGFGVGVTSGLSGLVDFRSASAGQTILNLQNTSGASTAALLKINGDTSSSVLMVSLVAGDSQNRFALRGSGQLEFGTGAAPRDTNFYRSASGVLNSSGQLAADASAPTDDSHLTRKDYVDNAIAAIPSGGDVTTNTAQTITGLKTFEGATAADPGIQVRVTSDTNPRFILGADGKMLWGPGNATQDTNLYRSAADTLKTDDNLIVNSTLTGGVLAVVGAATVGGTLGVTGVTTLAAMGATTGTFSSTLGVTGTATMGVINASGTVTAANLTTGGNLTVSGIGKDQVGILASDATYTSNVSPANVTGMSAAVVANATYLVEVIAVWTTGGGGFRCDFTGPSGATMVWTDNDGTGNGAIGTDSTFNATTGTTMRGFLLTSGTAGTLQFRAAQSTSNASGTVLLAGSGLYVRRLA